MTPTSPELKNIRDILNIERENLSRATALDRLTDAVGRLASGTWFVVIHLTWFIVWIGLNSNPAPRSTRSHSACSRSRSPSKPSC